MEDTVEELQGWFAGRIPDGWFSGPPEVTVDREEILGVGTLPDVDLGSGASAASLEAARLGGTEQHRDCSRGGSVRLARAGGDRFRREVSWGAGCGEVEAVFFTHSLP